MKLTVLLAIFAGGYAAAIYTWPRLRLLVNGTEVQAAKLMAEADALLAKAKASARN
jgi:hypothetical protein